jgi:hypothetical protein
MRTLLALLALGPIASWTSAQEGVKFQGPEIEQFMAEASITGMVDIGEGVTRPQKATLELDGETQHGVFKTVDIFREGMTRVGDIMEMNFQDSYKTEIAAYEIDRLIDLGLVPATLERSYRGNRGSLQWWVESEMSEADRAQGRILPPDRQSWGRMMSKVRLFDSLIYNTDRHQRNIRITKDWTIILIDHSRTFRTEDELREPEQIMLFSRSLLENIARLDEDTLKDRVGRHLTIFQIRAVLARRDLLLERAKELVAERGEERVLFP